VEYAKKQKKDAERKAKSEKDENLKYDQVWCVFDIDNHPKVNDAKQMANANDIQVAVSNQSFEIWLILHFQDSPGPQHRRELVKILKFHLKDYDKKINFEDFKDGYEKAVARARRLDEDAERLNEPGRNPTTGVWRLTESIKGK
jgi:hypothetical protein